MSTLSIINKNKIEGPEFTAEEMNKLISLARKHNYYIKARKFVEDYMADRIEYKHMSQRQQRWIWGIKTDLIEAVNENS